METGWFVMKQEKAVLLKGGRLSSKYCECTKNFQVGRKSLENQRNSEKTKQVMMRSISAWDG